MAEFAPQYNFYKTIGKLKLFGNILFWFIPFLSISHTICKRLVFPFDVTDIVNIANLIAIVVFFIIEIVVDYILVPMAENKLRDDFIPMLNKITNK